MTSHACCVRLALVVSLVGTIMAPTTTHGAADGGQAQPQEVATRLVIPFLANATKPDDLDFAAAECDARSSQMTCRFRQVFLTRSPLDANACVMTTNGYEATFRREGATRWVSAGAPTGACGLVETTTLENDGGPRWTMTIRFTATLKPDAVACRAAAPEIYSWKDLKRKLPCTSVQPGAIER